MGGISIRLQGNRARQRVGSAEDRPAVGKVSTEPEFAQVIEPPLGKRSCRNGGDRGTKEGIARANDLVNGAILGNEDGAAARNQVGGKDHLPLIVERGAGEAAIRAGQPESCISSGCSRNQDQNSKRE